MFSVVSSKEHIDIYIRRVFEAHLRVFRVFEYWRAALHASVRSCLKNRRGLIFSYMSTCALLSSKDERHVDM